MNIYKELFAKDNNGSIRVWRIGIENDKIKIEHGQLGGSIQTQTENVPEGKAGRDRLTQFESRMRSRINSKIDSGYVESIEKAERNKRTNAAGLLKPMLAKKLSDVKNADYSNSYVQYKYDGNRCLITNQGGELIAYSRNGKRIDTLDHILQDINLPEGATIDGELYCHGFPLQTIVSWVKRKQAHTDKICFHAYDIIDDVPYSTRLSMLNNIGLHGSANVVPTWKVNSFEETQKHFKIARVKGYEGSIIRLNDYGYEDGKRSKSLIKVKAWQDAEFSVTDILRSADGWAILECSLPNGKSFRVSAPGSIDEKRYVLDNKDFYIFRQVRVEYAQLTKDGIPFHPVAINWRNPKDE